MIYAIKLRSKLRKCPSRGPPGSPPGGLLGPQGSPRGQSWAKNSMGNTGLSFPIESGDQTPFQDLFRRASADRSWNLFGLAPGVLRAPLETECP